MLDTESPDFEKEQPDEFASESEAVPAQSDYENEELSNFDIKLKLSDEQKKSIVSYLEDNLPKMRPPAEEIQRIQAYLGMYEMAAHKRAFPYENAPSLASSDAHDTVNEQLDVAETTFLQTRVTNTIDREETTLNEATTERLEKTFHRKFFLPHMASELRLLLFESIYLGCSVQAVREVFDVKPIKQKLVLQKIDDLAKIQSQLTKAQFQKAQKALSEGKTYITETEGIQMENVGPRSVRVDLTKFWFPRNTKLAKEWQIVAEPEFYTKSSLLELVERGEMDADAVNRVLESRAQQREYKDDKEKSGMLESVKVFKSLDDSGWEAGSSSLDQKGDSYEEEFVVYRVSSLYNLPTKQDPQGRLRSWVQFMYCPTGQQLLSETYLQDGFPYYLVQRRPVPYRAMGPGIAQERYQHNLLDTECKSLFLASVEQEVGAPLLIRKNSMLYASGFRAYPSSVAYVDNIAQDAGFLPFPEKSRLAVNGMSMILGSSPSANKGAGYASGKREELMQGKEMLSYKARMLSIAMDMDKITNAVWRIYCRLAKYNRPERKIVPWVYDNKPEDGQKLYALISEMREDVIWSSVLSAVSLTPDARWADFLMKYEFFYRQQPVLQGNPEKTIAWLNYAADVKGIDERLRMKLLPDMKDFMEYQAKLGAMGGEREEAQATPDQAQSSSTPFSRPPNQRNGHRK